MPGTVEKHSLTDELHSKPDSTIVQRLLFSVGGMSCAACSGTITRALSDVDDFSNVTVHLMEQSLSLQAHPGMKEKVVEIVEELGYECTFAAARPLNEPTIPVGEKAPPRVIEIKVDNLACP
jgi:Cu+-exporting ATPase